MHPNLHNVKKSVSAETLSDLKPLSPSQKYESEMDSVSTVVREVTCAADSWLNLSLL